MNTAHLLDSTVATDADREHAGARAPRLAIILAAGAGTRFGSVPKPLLRVHGMRLIERAIVAFSRAGVERFLVVTGAYPEDLAAVPDLPRLRDLDVELVHCPTWAEGNGHSLATGAARVDEPFYLAMADHVFDPAIVEELGRAFVGAPESVHLATDADIGDVFDVPDATKVRTSGDRIVAIGKDLETYDRVDVGVFACPRTLGREAAAALARGARGVSDIMRELIQAGRMRSVPVDGRVWQDVDTPQMRAEAERRLLASTRKPTDGPVSRWLNRPVSLAVSRVLARFDVRPNTVTTVVFTLGIIAAALIAQATPGALVAGAILTQLASVLDGCDGELSRVNMRGSTFGAWYDTITDNIRYMLMVVAAGFALHRTTGSESYLIAAAVFVAAAVFLVATMVQYLRRHKERGTHLVIVARVEATQAANPSPLARVLFRLRFLAKQDVLALLAAIAFALQLPIVVLAGGLLAVAAMIYLVDRALAADGEPADGSRALLGLAGGGLLAWMLVDAPLGEITGAIGRMGPAVLLVVPVVLAWSLANALAVHRLLGGRVELMQLLMHRLVGDGYNAVVPAAGVGGEPVRIAMLRAYVPVAEAAAAVVTDRVLNLVASFLVSAGALTAAVLLLELPGNVEVALATYAAVAVALAALLLAVVLRGGAGRLTSRIARWVGGDGVAPARVIPGTAIARALVWHVVGRMLAGLEVALYASLLGLDLSLVEISFVTGVLHGIGAIAFMVPQGLGVAELSSAYVFELLGYATPIGLAFGLVRRARLLAFSALGIALHVALRSAPDARASDPTGYLRK